MCVQVNLRPQTMNETGAFHQIFGSRATDDSILNRSLLCYPKNWLRRSHRQLKIDFVSRSLNCLHLTYLRFI